jgi:hypothetical protein
MQPGKPLPPDLIKENTEALQAGVVNWCLAS